MADGPSNSFWRIFTAAPHRMMFFGGAIQLVVPLLWWAAELAGRQLGLAHPAPVIGSLWGHVYLMVFTLFPFFIFGFLMTTYPRWMNGTVVPERSYVASFLLLFLGVLLAYAGLFRSKELLALGMAVHLAGWGVGYLALLRVYREVKGRANRYYETHLNVAFACGWLGELAYLAFVLTGDGTLAYVGLRIAIWLFLVPVLLTVGHRMIPFFSSTVIKPYQVVQPGWTLPVMWAGCSGHLLLETAGRIDLLFLADLPLLVAALFLTFRWGFRRSFEARLLAVLHLAFLAFSVAMALYVFQSLWLLAGGGLVLGRGPLHVLLIGFITGMVVAMATRVSLGHSGRPLVMDTFSWLCFLGIEAVALLRLMGDLNLEGQLLLPGLNAIAAIAWLAVITPWALRYGYIYLRPRADGRPG